MNGSVIDMHVHLWGHHQQKDEDVLRAMLDRYDIEWLGVIPLWGGRFPARSEIVAGNVATARFCRQDASRRKAYVTVNPCHGAAARDDIRRGIEDGAVAVKIWVAARADNPVTFPIAETCLEFNVPLLIHAFRHAEGQPPHESDAPHIASLARRFPELKIIMAHLAANHLWGCAHIASCPNVWSDFSGTYCEAGTLETAVRLLGEDRVLFGSDAPGADFMGNLAKVEEADLTEIQRTKIRRQNALRLFKQQPD